MAAPYTKTYPNWMSKQDENDLTLNPNYRRSIKYYKKLYAAWPEWCTDDPRYKKIYNDAKMLRSMGEDVHVDHIVPLCSEIVCGLHVPWNLQIIDKQTNLFKSNLYWPDHPFENKTLF